MLKNQLTKREKTNLMIVIGTFVLLYIFFQVHHIWTFGDGEGEYGIYVIDSTSSKNTITTPFLLKDIDCVQEYIAFYQNYNPDSAMPCDAEYMFVHSVDIIKFSRDSLLVKVRAYYTNMKGGSETEIFYVYYKLLHKR